MSNTFLLGGLLLWQGVALAAGPAQGATQDMPMDFPFFAANCYNCHGTEGHAVGRMPPLSGLGENRMLALLLEFKRGQRAATVMHQLSRGYTDEELAMLARYFSRQAPRISVQEGL